MIFVHFVISKLVFTVVLVFFLLLINKVKTDIYSWILKIRSLCIYSIKRFYSFVKKKENEKEN